MASHGFSMQITKSHSDLVSNSLVISYDVLFSENVCVCVTDQAILHNTALFVCFPKLLFSSSVCGCVDSGEIL